MSSSSSAASKRICIIGFGAVGQAFLRTLKAITAKGLLSTAQIHQVSYYAPEIKEYSKDGMFEFNPAPFVSRDNLTTILDNVCINTIVAVSNGPDGY